MKVINFFFFLKYIKRSVVDIYNMNTNSKKDNKTNEEIEKERKERLKEYRRNYYRDYYCKNPDKRKERCEKQKFINKKKYEENEEYRLYKIQYSKSYRQSKKLQNDNINERLVKLDMLETLLNNNIDFKNSSISIKV